MGNCLVWKSISSASGTAKLIDTRNGTLTKVNIPMKAAELMLEYPRNVVSSSKQIESSKRISVLRADDEMEVGKVYLLFPVCRVNCRVTEAETMVLEAVLGRKRSIGVSNSQVAPVGEMAVEDEEMVVVAKRMRWCPVQETISEMF